MTISTIDQTLSTFPTAPSRDQDQTTFVTNAENHILALGNHVTEVNTQIGQINTTVEEINTDISGIDNKVTQAETAEANASASATSAANSASLAALTANNLGAWSALTGSFDLGNSVNHSDSVWVANVDIADVTLSEPSSSNTDWTEASSASLKWEDATTATATLLSNKQYNVYATSASIDVTLPSPLKGDSLLITNDAASTQPVRFIVSGSVELISLNNITYTATTDVTMEAGDAIYLACTKTDGTWEQK